MRHVYAVIVGLGLVVAIAVWWMLSSVNHVSSTDTTSVQFVVTSGQKLRTVATVLQQQKFIPSAGAWVLYAITQGQRSAILDGSYTLNYAMNGREILRTLSSDPLPDNVTKVTLAEGLTLKQIAEQLEKANVVNGQEFLNLVQHPATSGFDITPYRIARQKPATVDFEGYLFPDTYEFFKHSKPADVVKKILKNLDVKFTPEIEQAAVTTGHTPHEILTMASILEKELTTAADRAKGSDVFWKRIAAGIPLQSNVTILYAMGLTEDRLTIADTKFNSPYNTYQNKGLPPGPINNPGIVSIKAAISPEANAYYYFLSAPDGTTYFATTLDQHNRYKAQYLK